MIFHIMRFSLHDGPGIRTAVFFKGCPLSCWWCHNPESQNAEPEVLYSADRCRLCGDCSAACPHGAIERIADRMTVTDECRRCGTCVDACGAEARSVAGRTMTVSEIVAEAERDLVFFDESGGGVTFTGGEPFAQPELLEALLHACRQRRIHTTIETCGAAARDSVLRIAAAGGSDSLRSQNPGFGAPPPVHGRGQSQHPGKPGSTVGGRPAGDGPHSDRAGRERRSPPTCGRCATTCRNCV